MSLWGDKILRSSSKELRDVDFFVYVKPAGLLGRLLGRALRFRVTDFSGTVSRRDGALRYIDVEPNSLEPEYEVYEDTKFERAPLTYSEKEKLRYRLKRYVLQTDEYPDIHYEVDQETATMLMGRLDLHGEEQPLKCSKSIEGTELHVRCPVSLRSFGIQPYTYLYGLFTQQDEVEVEVRVPASVLSL